MVPLTEETVLSGILNSSDFLYEIGDFITPSFFFNGNNSWLYGKLLEIRNSYNSDPNNINKKLSLDPNSINYYLTHEERGNQDLQNYINNIYYINPPPKTFYQTLDNIKDKYFITILDQKLNRTKETISSSTPSIGILQDHYDEIGKIILESSRQQTFIHISKNVPKYLEEYAKHQGKPPGINVTNMPYFTDFLNGLQRKKLYVVGSRAKTGKSTLAMNIGTNAARQGIPVLVLDTELSDEEYASRQLSHISYYLDNDLGIPMGITEKDIINGTFAIDRTKGKRLIEAKAILDSIPFYHVSIGSSSPSTIQNIILQFFYQVRHYVPENMQNAGVPACFIIFDWLKPSSYLQDGASHGRTQEHQVIGDLTEMLKKLSRELNIPLLAATQTGRSDKADVKESDIRGMQTEIAQFDRVVQYCDVFMWLQTLSDSSVNKIGKGNGDKVIRFPYVRGGPGSIAGIVYRYYGHYLTFRENDFHKNLIKQSQ